MKSFTDFADSARPVNPRDPPIPASPVLGLQSCTNHVYLLHMDYRHRTQAASTVPTEWSPQPPCFEFFHLSLFLGSGWVVCLPLTVSVSAYFLSFLWSEGATNDRRPPSMHCWTRTLGTSLSMYFPLVILAVYEGLIRTWPHHKSRHISIYTRDWCKPDTTICADFKWPFGENFWGYDN